MSVKPETTFYISVHRHLPPPSKLHREKMSNPYRGGTADFWYDGPKADLWIEWKFIVLPKRPSTLINLIDGRSPIISPLQQDWLLERHRNGRTVWVVVGSKIGGVVFPDLLWQRPIHCSDFCAQSASRDKIAGRIVAHTGCRP